MTLEPRYRHDFWHALGRATDYAITGQTTYLVIRTRDGAFDFLWIKGRMPAGSVIWASVDRTGVAIYQAPAEAAGLLGGGTDE